MTTTNIYNYNKKNLEFKTCLIGNHLTGKSSLLKRYNEGVFKEGPSDWFGVEMRVNNNVKIKSKTDDIPETDVRLTVFDFNGGYKFLELSKSYYKSCNGFLLCYSPDIKESFNDLTKWINEINENYIPSEENSYKKPSILIVGLKSDIPIELIQVDIKEAKKFCDSLSIPSIHTVSSKDNIDVEKVFQLFSQLIYDNGSFNQNGKTPTFSTTKIKENKCIIN